jgi:ASPIC and UnbV/Dockerin type I domain
MTSSANLLATGLPMYCAVVGDIDADGDLDLLTNPHGSNLRLHVNQTNASANWSKFRVAGERHDLDAIGATVQVTTGSTNQIRQVLVGGNGYLGQNGLEAHFGLGSATQMDKIVVSWPYTGSTRALVGYGINTRWTLLPPGRMGDFDDDGSVTQADLSALASHLGQSVIPGLEALDMNSDGVLASSDYPLMLNLCTAPVGDLNSDGVVDGADLAVVLGSWGNGPSSADLDGDGTVNGADLTIVLGNWG